MIPNTRKVSPEPNVDSNSAPRRQLPSKAYIATMCEYICKSSAHNSKAQSNPVASSNIKPAKKHEDMFIFWT